MCHVKCALRTEAWWQRGGDEGLTSETNVSNSVASSLPLVWCSARETMDRFGRYGDMVASANTMAADMTAVKMANSLHPYAPHSPWHLPGDFSSHVLPVKP